MTSSFEDNNNIIISPISSVGNKIKYYTGIWYTEIIDDADFDYGKGFQKNLTKYSKFNDIIILKTMKT